MVASYRNLLVIAALVMGGAGTPTLAKGLPASRKVTFEKHENPSDASSRVSWIFTLHLTPQSQSGNSIAWHVDSATIEQTAYGSQPYRQWTQTNPAVDTSDGLWHVTHNTPASPQVADFSMPPSITGTAGPITGTPTRLMFRWEGASVSPLPSGFGAGADYWFTLEAGTEPEVEGDGEPIVVHNDEDQ